MTTDKNLEFGTGRFNVKAFVGFITFWILILHFLNTNYQIEKYLLWWMIKTWSNKKKSCKVKIYFKKTLFIRFQNESSFKSGF